MKRIFLAPSVGTEGPDVLWYPKYMADHDPATGASWNLVGAFSSMEYGLGGFYIVVATDIQATLDNIAAQPDVYGGWPEVVADSVSTAKLGGQQANQIKNYIEAYGCPGDWIGANETWDQTLRTLTVFCQFTQRLYGRGQTELVPAGVHLNTLWQDLPADYRADFEGTFTDLGVPTDWIDPTDRMRTVLREAERNYTGQITLGGLGLD